ncbi:MAG: hypothetical protein ACLR84_06185 [Clostridia bacterium]
MEDELTITVRLLFQPAEECIENSGAALMKDDPALLECDRLIAMHIWSKIPAGYASLRYGPVMSAADTFDIYVKGKGGHGALPHQTRPCCCSFRVRSFDAACCCKRVKSA